jgi:hypothetical protein
VTSNEEVIAPILPDNQMWPELMNAGTAARYLGERSARAFRRRAGKVYPSPVRIAGRGEVWRRTDLAKYVAALRGPVEQFNDLADVL